MFAHMGLIYFPYEYGVKLHPFTYKGLKFILPYGAVILLLAEVQN